MNSLKGHLLIATPQLQAPLFTRSVILMLEHTEEGAIGLILARFDVPAGAIAIVLGVDRILDMCRTAVNVTADLTTAVYVAKSEAGRGEQKGQNSKFEARNSNQDNPGSQSELE